MVRSLALAVVLGWAFAFLPATPADTKKGVEPTNLDRLNTKTDEDEPHLSADGLHLFYAANVDGAWDIFRASRRAVTQPWARGEPVAELNTNVDDRGAALITTAGKYPHYLYFATKKDDMKGSNFDIYVAVKQGPKADFTAPTPVNSVCTPADEMHPWVTANGRELYFSRKTKDGWRVFVASRAGGGAFGEPKPVNLPVNYCHATLTPDGNVMYLQGALDDKRTGLFRSRRTGGTWSAPEPLVELNSTEGPTGDRSPSLSRDGMALYFTSDRPGGKGGLDLWMVPTLQLKK